jgi:replicative DNA helicase
MAVVRKKKFVAGPAKESEDKSDAPVLRVAAGDPINEAMVIAGVIADEKARKRYVLTTSPDHFFSPKNVLIWLALQEVERRGIEYSPEAVKRFAGKDLDIEYLREIADTKPQSGIRFHVENLQWDLARVNLGKGPLSAALEGFRDPTTPPERLRAMFNSCVKSLEGQGSNRYIRDCDALAIEQDAELTKLREGTAVYPFGIDGLDYYHEHDNVPLWAGKFTAQGKRVPRLIPGAYPGLLTLVSGLSGHGKTTATGRKILNSANAGRMCLYGAWEVTSGITLRLHATMSLGMSRSDIMVGSFTQKEQRALVAEMKRLGQFIRFFELPKSNKSERYQNDLALDMIEQTITDSGCDLFAGDLIKKVMTETKPDDEERFVDGLSKVAQRTRCHVIAVHQMAKDTSMKGHRIDADRLKGSSAWFQLPDTVIIWDCPWLIKPGMPKNKIEAHAVKQRYGELFRVEIDYDPEYASFGEGRTIEHEDADGFGKDTADNFDEDFLSDKPKVKRKSRR